MRQFNILATIMAIAIVSVFGCQQSEDIDIQVTEPVDTEIAHSASYVTLDAFPLKFKKGSYTSGHDCGDMKPCGPCAGFCVRWEPKKKKKISSTAYEAADYASGERDGGGKLIDDFTYRIYFTLGQGVDYNSTVHLDGNVYLDSDLALESNKSSIELTGGTYSITSITPIEGFDAYVDFSAVTIDL